MDHASEISLTREKVGQTAVVLQPERTMAARAPQVAVEQEHPRAGLREAGREVEAADGLSLARPGARDEDHLGRRTGRREEDRGPQAAERLGCR